MPDQITSASARNIAHGHAAAIGRRIVLELGNKSSKSIERATLRILGCTGDKDGHPLVNLAIDALEEAGELKKGAALWLGKAMVHTRQSPADILNGAIGQGGPLPALSDIDENDARARVALHAASKMAELKNLHLERRKKRSTARHSGPRIYCLTATGDVREDIIHLRVAANAGADIIAIIRSTAQSLYDHVPEGETRVGYGGTFATQANFQLLREAADQWSNENGRYLELSSFCSGLCMPEIAAIGILEQFDNMVNDALYGALYRDINVTRTLVDQHFSRGLNGFFGIRINTGEDNYLRTEDRVGHAPNVLASQLINFHSAREAGLSPDLIAVGNACEIDPDTQGGILNEIAYSQLTREVFPGSPVKYMPPTRYMDGDVFRTHAIDQVFNIVASMTDQGLMTAGSLTEGLFTPHIHDRAISVEAAAWVRRFTTGLSEEIQWRRGGQICKLAESCLDQAIGILAHVSDIGMHAAIAEGVFGGIHRSSEDGRGYDGVFEKHPEYFNPIADMVFAQC